MEWWHPVAVSVAIGLHPMLRAIAVILLAKFVKPDLVKQALPLIFGHKARSPGKRLRSRDNTH